VYDRNASAALTDKVEFRINNTNAGAIVSLVAVNSTFINRTTSIAFVYLNQTSLVTLTIAAVDDAVARGNVTYALGLHPLLLHSASFFALMNGTSTDTYYPNNTWTHILIKSFDFDTAGRKQLSHYFDTR
jgi:hypothetical protein